MTPVELYWNSAGMVERFFSGDIKILYTKILFPNFLYKMNFIMQVPNKHKFFQEIEKINDRFDIFRRI